MNNQLHYISGWRSQVSVPCYKRKWDTMPILSIKTLVLFPILTKLANQSDKSGHQYVASTNQRRKQDQERRIPSREGSIASRSRGPGRHSHRRGREHHRIRNRTSWSPKRRPGRRIHPTPSKQRPR